MKYAGRPRRLFERLLNGPAPSDPLYLTNRTLGQKVRRGVMIGLPCAAIVAIVALAAAGRFDRSGRPDAAPRPPTDAEIAEKMLPGLNQEFALDTNRNLQVSDVSVGGRRLSGTVKNVTDHVILDAEVVFDLAGASGSRVGAVSCRVARVESHGTAACEAVLAQADAVYAVVREVHAQ